jgi:hypothetical protein
MGEILFMRPPAYLQTMREKREWLEEALPIPEEIRNSRAYRELSDESKIILMLMMDRQRGDGHADA